MISCLLCKGMLIPSALSRIYETGALGLPTTLPPTAPCCRNRLEGVKKLVPSTLVPKGRVDFQSFRMRSLRLRVTCNGNKDMCLSGLMPQCFNFQRLRSKASPIHPFFRFDSCARFFHTFSVTGFLEIRQGYWRTFRSIPVGSTTYCHH
jgi:hypothetical protein